MFPQEMKNHVHTKMVYIGFIGDQKDLRNNLNVPRLGNGKTNCSVSIQWNTIQQQKEQTTDTHHSMVEPQMHHAE